jgi:SAM-dependent methyltransferase
MANEYSSTWFEVFMGSFPVERTKAQLAFIKKYLLLPQYRRVLDVCSGWGRIAGPLAWAGYEVTAVDRDRECVKEGGERNPKVAFIELDMRKLPSLGKKYDAVISLWQSFGYFDEITNRRILGDMAELLTPGGRIILDLYNRAYFEKRQGVEASTVAGARIDTERVVKGKRLRTRVDYGGGKADDFDWELYTPREAVELAAGCGLKATVLCANFDEATPPADDKPSFQLVLTGE